MKIRWTHAAAGDLQHIKDYLAEHHPQYTQSTIIELYEAVRSLKALPLRGKLGRIKGTRELVLTQLPYIVAYRVTEQAVEILHIYHGAQNRP